ncbi:MAG: 50S ribosomal protein L11 methyltransferase [Pseudomonadota bacterium]
MAYLSLSVDLEGLDPAAAEAACFNAGALSVTLTDAVDDAILEPRPGELRLWPQTVLQALFDADTAGPVALIALAGALELPASRIRVTQLADRVWEREWLKDFHAMQFGRRLWILPHHESLPADPQAVVVRLDPGLAFGTGTHPSTALCLTWLDANLQPQARVIDYGCGSGVLAIAAARLGAAQVDCHDIDPQAAIATRDNAAANQVGERILLHDDPATLPRSAEVLLANIISGTLIELAPRFAELLPRGGHLVLAGILDDQAASVIEAYSGFIALTPAGERDGWTALAGQRR